MIILGLDPGIGRTGFGVLDTMRKELFVRCGVLTTPTHGAEEDRLVTLGSDLEKLIKDTKPDIAVVEKIFFGSNVKTAVSTAQARGVLLYVLRKHHIAIETLTPLQIKSRLTGYGRAGKQQMQTIVVKRLRLTQPPRPDDAADALAAALCIADKNPKKGL